MTELFIDGVVIPILASVVVGAIAAVGAIKGIKIHIDYLKQEIDTTTSSTRRAHERIDQLQREMLKVLTQVEMILSQITISIKSKDGS